MGNIPGKLNALDNKVATRLIEIRHARKFTIEQLAEISGVSRATLSRIERSETSPTAHVLGQLSAVYGLTISQLLVEVEEKGHHLTKWSKAQKWVDSETGFKRVILSPPSNDFSIQIMHGELPKGAVIEYPAPPLKTLEQHIIVLEGRLYLSFNQQNFTLDVLDCLRVKLIGASRFFNAHTGPSRYLIASEVP